MEPRIGHEWVVVDRTHNFYFSANSNSFEKAKRRLIYKQNLKKYFKSICAGFTRLAKAHTPVICENSERAGAEYRHRGVGECREVGRDPNTRLSTPGTQSIFQSRDHQKGNVWLTEKRRISKEERKPSNIWRARSKPAGRSRNVFKLISSVPVWVTKDALMLLIFCLLRK